MSDKQKTSADDMFAPRVCAVEGCGEKASPLMWNTPFCFRHHVAHQARWMTEEELAYLRADLAEVHILTPEERRAIERERRLTLIRNDANHHTRDLLRAIVDGIPVDEIEAAYAEGVRAARGEHEGVPEAIEARVEYMDAHGRVIAETFRNGIAGIGLTDSQRRGVGIAFVEALRANPQQ